MKRLILPLLAAMTAIISSAAQPSSRYELKVGDFDELKVVDGINVDYMCDPSRAGLVEFEATKDVASAVVFEPSKGRLSVKLASRDTIYTGLPKVIVYSSHLTNVSNEGDSLVRVLSLPQGARFSCRVIGNGRLSVRDLVVGTVKASILSGRGIISIYGRADEASLKVAGAGTIQADDLEAKEVSCTSAGTGSISCYATSRLSVGGLGGTVRYRGNPELKKRFMSAVKVNPIE